MVLVSEGGGVIYWIGLSLSIGVWSLGHSDPEGREGGGLRKGVLNHWGRRRVGW